MDIPSLKKTPIPIDRWKYQQVGKFNDGPYKKEYPKIQVTECGEPLVNISEFGLVSSDFYLDEYLAGKSYLGEGISKNLFYSKALLRQSVAQRLQKVDGFLRSQGYFLHIQSGWRHPDIQSLVKGEYAKENGQEAADKLFAPVINGAAPPPHSTGGAFDLEIRSLSDGLRQELYYVHEGRHIYGSYYLEEIATDIASISLELINILENRRMLYHILCTPDVCLSEDEVFCCHPGECWHFGDGDPLSSYLSRHNVAKFGFVTL